MQFYQAKITKFNVKKVNKYNKRTKE